MKKKTCILGTDHFAGKFYQMFKEKVTPKSFKLFQKTQILSKIRGGRIHFPNLFYGTSKTLTPKTDKHM